MGEFPSSTSPSSFRCLGRGGSRGSGRGSWAGSSVYPRGRRPPTLSRSRVRVSLKATSAPSPSLPRPELEISTRLPPGSGPGDLPTRRYLPCQILLKDGVTPSPTTLPCPEVEISTPLPPGSGPGGPPTRYFPWRTAHVPAPRPVDPGRRCRVGRTRRRTGPVP